jgi:hypothetical protein
MAAGTDATHLVAIVSGEWIRVGPAVHDYPRRPAPGNIAQEQNRLVIYDWTDAAISFPTLDGVMLASCVPDDHVLRGLGQRWSESIAR